MLHSREIKELWYISGSRIAAEGFPSSFRHLQEFWFTAHAAYRSLDTILITSPHLHVICSEGLAGLARYRATLYTETREASLSIASSYYSRAADRHQEIRGYQRHLATPAKLDLLKQLFHHIKALIRIQPDTDARQDISGFFCRIHCPTVIKGYPVVLTSFIKTHETLFNRDNASTFTILTG
jgi:hypothetical protein